MIRRSAFNLAGWSLLTGFAANLAACSATVLTPSPADRLREENAALEAKVKSLEYGLAEAKAELADIERSRKDAAIDPEALASKPHLAVVEVAGSSVIEVDADGRGTLMARLVPRDGRGRFIQIAGRVSIRASLLSQNGSPTLVGERKFAPLEVQDAWRSGFFGTIYLFEVPVEIPAALRSVREATVLATFHDGIGGGEYSRLSIVPIVEENGKDSP